MARSRSAAAARTGQFVRVLASSPLLMARYSSQAAPAWLARLSTIASIRATTTGGETNFENSPCPNATGSQFWTESTAWKYEQKRMKMNGGYSLMEESSNPGLHGMW